MKHFELIHDDKYHLEKLPFKNTEKQIYSILNRNKLLNEIDFNEI